MPVIIVGNITVGGTGKTPLVASLVTLLRGAGFRPGIVSRGYKGRAKHWPQAVTARSDPALVGDEPVLLARRCACPVIVAPDRVSAARKLLETSDCNIVISDDGLQHYRLQRDIEIAVIDGVRRHGNGFCLPAGPLREPLERLGSVDFVIVNGANKQCEYRMTLAGASAANLANPTRCRPLADFANTTVHAVAGIAHPERFFQALREIGIDCIKHAFPDHHGFTAKELDFHPRLPILMTEKDALKCTRFATGDAWYVPVTAELETGFKTRLLNRLADCTK